MKKYSYILLFILVLKVRAQQQDFKHINFKKADSIALQYKNESVTNLPLLSSLLNKGLKTDVEKFRAIYFWVCANIENDYDMFLKNKRKRFRFRNKYHKQYVWNSSLNKEVFDKLITQKKTVCTGYAYLVKKLCEYADIECEMVYGFGKKSLDFQKEIDQPNHTWNAVKLNSKWYLCDATWASGYQNYETLQFEFDYNDGFFLTQPELFAIRHEPLDKKWLLFSDQTKEFQFENQPVLYNEAYRVLANHQEPKHQFKEVDKYELINFKHELTAQVNNNEIYLLVDNGANQKEEKPTIVTNKNNYLVFTHRFHKKGQYDVHLFLKQKPIATYTFSVD